MRRIRIDHTTRYSYPQTLPLLPPRGHGRRCERHHIGMAVHRHPEAIPPRAGAFIGPSDRAAEMRVEVSARQL